MQLFYNPTINEATETFSFDKEESKHIIKVLRKKDTDILQVTNGLGFLFTTEITLASDTKCTVKIISTDSAVSIFVANINDSLGFTVVDSSTNYNVNEVNGKISASQKLNAPYYLQGASQVLSISAKNDQSQVMFSISIIAMDHRGEDICYMHYHKIILDKNKKGNPIELPFFVCPLKL